MTDIAIRVENLGKRYQLGPSKSGSFRESLSNLFRTENGKRTGSPGETEAGKNDPVSVLPSPVSVLDFWALQDINFEIKRGEAVGIIGRNGAGKSTLLKILSRITEPTKGRFEIFGRVSSLLEVGTGFHPELTGRENVYLNGTILGMKRREVKAKFDEIVAFSGVEKFIDTPVKHYSSGMQVRLAFAVAAHLEPEILIIDEVLAVGDSVFQAKCIDKMTEVAKSGRTILFVSHNMQAVKKLCTRGILIKDGIVNFDGSVDDIIEKYSLSDTKEGSIIPLSEIKRNKNTAEELVFDELIFENYPISFGDEISISLKLKSVENSIFRDLDFGIAIKDRNHQSLIHVSNRFIHQYYNHSDDETRYTFSIENLLKPGTYYITLFLRSDEVVQDWLENAVKMIIEDGNPYDYNDNTQFQGSILPKFDINTRQSVLL